jgi:hypothetical protein
MKNPVYVNELNPLENPKGYHNIERARINWEELKTTDRIYCERIRFLTDPGFPFMDLSYFHATVNGEKCIIENSPFWQIPKRTWKTYLIKQCKKDKLFVRGIIENASILW